MMKKFLAIVGLALTLITLRVMAQCSYIDLTIVETSNYNVPIANFSYATFDKSFQICAGDQVIPEENLQSALVLFLNNLTPKKSFIIQNEPTFYFVFQYNKKDDTYLVMNNSVGSSGEAMYVRDYDDAKVKMLGLLLEFYSTIPVVSITEFK